MDSGDLSFLPLVRNFRRGLVIEAHVHPFPQLLYAQAGVLSVSTDQGNWVIPPHRALWLPPLCVHEVRMLTDTNITSLMLRTCAGLDALECSVLDVSPLLRALLLSALQLDAARDKTEREDLMLALLKAEIVAARTNVSPIPLPKNEKLRALCQAAVGNLLIDCPVTYFADELGITVRTFSRLFKREIGMSYREWMDRVRVSYARAQLDQGTPAKVVASDLGYTPSAFSTMMRRAGGRSAAETDARSGGEVVWADLPPLNWFTRTISQGELASDGRWAVPPVQ
ncbi:AraC family transcriptional regulator [Ensifer adhaerens]|uniref:AraC family transcriptional regulator n=1 Tax=Ensifer adhaerens TaxID=106592 RepID=UPI000CF081E5|nr:helix-turn-helix transcriptional regulator [Ensifer adhaerens]